jgi:hypothetical protein
MSRYRPFGPHDDAALEERDEGFAGFRSRVQPGALPAGIARLIENGRCERGTFRVRAGTKAVSTEVELDNPTLELPFDLGEDISVASITRSGTVATVTTSVAHSYTTGNQVNIRGAAQDDYNGDQLITVTGATEFTFTVANSPPTPATGTIVANLGPILFADYAGGVRASCEWTSTEKVDGCILATRLGGFLYRYGENLVAIDYPAGETVEVTDACALEQYLDKAYLFRGYQTAPPLAVASIARSDTTATVTTSDDHELTTGDWVTLAGADQVEYGGIYQVTVTGDTTFTVEVAGAPTTPATGTITARPCKPPLVWDGDVTHDFVVVTTGAHPTGGTLIRMPACDWGVEFTRRLAMGYARTELILSDFGDATTADTQYGELRIRPGSSDWLVGVKPYQDMRLLVLYRKSAHMVVLDSSTAAPVAVEEITRDFGCVARRSAANCGGLLLWLADQGVHGAQIDQNLNLVPLQRPLSADIQDQIEKINWAYAAGAVARYWNNRYYIAVPTGDSTTNNTILVFNFMNRSADSPLGEWESVDSFQRDFDMQDLHVLDYANQKRLHAMTSFGWLFLLEELESDEWGTPYQTLATYAIPGGLYLRDYKLGSTDRKKFTRARLLANLTTGDSYTVKFVARNPDSTTTLKTTTATATTDVDDPIRVPRLRGSAGTLEITTTAGRPEIRAVALEATLGDRINTPRS